MKVIVQDNSNFILRFDKDEEVVAGLENFMAEQSIKACAFFAIGAASQADLGFFNPFVKDYRKKPYVDEFEIISFSGNGSIKDGKPAIHGHGMFGRNDFTTIGGHVFALKVGVTCEVFLTKLNGEMKRENNPDFNLSLLA